MKKSARWRPDVDAAIAEVVPQLWRAYVVPYMGNRHLIGLITEQK